jgi:RNase P/RNase MRP subunit p29
MLRYGLILIGLLVSISAGAATRAVAITGQVTDVREDMIVIQKGKQQWEIARGPSTKVRGELRKGALVTIEVYMSAGTIDVREEKKETK